jgi:hypothetical protein
MIFNLFILDKSIMIKSKGGKHKALICVINNNSFRNDTFLSNVMKLAKIHCHDIASDERLRVRQQILGTLVTLNPEQGLGHGHQWLEGSHEYPDDVILLDFEEKFCHDWSPALIYCLNFACLISDKWCFSFINYTRYVDDRVMKVRRQYPRRKDKVIEFNSFRHPNKLIWKFCSVYVLICLIENERKNQKPEVFSDRHVSSRFQVPDCQIKFVAADMLSCFEPLPC